MFLWAIDQKKTLLEPFCTTSLIENDIFIYLLLASTKENPFMFITREGGHKIRLALRTPFFLSFFFSFLILSTLSVFFFFNLLFYCREQEEFRSFSSQFTRGSLNHSTASKLARNAWIVRISHLFLFFNVLILKINIKNKKRYYFNIFSYKKHLKK